MEQPGPDLWSLRETWAANPAAFEDLFGQFADLYRDAFPIVSEAERPETFRQRIERPEPPPQPWFDIAVCVDPGRRPRVLGGICLEFYDESRCGLLTYVAVRPDQQRKGIARRLIEEAMCRLRAVAGVLGPEAIFAEAERPDRLPYPVPAPKEPRPEWLEQINIARERLSFLSRLGAWHVPVPYVQPALEPGQEPARHLMLLCFPEKKSNEQSSEAPRLPRAVLHRFLHEFQRALGVPDDDPGLRAATAGDEEEIALRRIEAGSLRLRDAVVCLHFVAEEPTLPFDSEVCPVVGSMELDLLSLSFQENPGFRTQCLTKVLQEDGSVLAAPREAWVRFPELTEYRSEGRLERRTSVTTRRRVQVQLSRTRFAAAGVTIWHLSLRPREGEYFDEFDVIKLIHLYDGLTEQTELRSQIAFSMTTEEIREGTLSAADLLRAAIEDCGVARGMERPPALVAGTIQVCQAPDGGFDLAGYPADPGLAAAVDAGEAVSRPVRALCGIVGGILDFEEIDGAEAADTLTADFSRPGLFIRIHRRTMIQVSHEDRGLETVRSTLGVSPYLVIPHAAIIYNEHQLERSQERADVASQEEQDARRRGRAVNLAILRDVSSIISDRMKRLWLSNVFNYVTERRLFATGLEGRGALERRASLELELANLGSCIESIYEKRRLDAETWINILLATIAIIQLKDALTAVGALLPGVPHLALALGLVGILSVGWFIYRWRRGTVRAVSLRGLSAPPADEKK